MDVKLGLGRATGMFYHAPANTALPTSLSGTLDTAWVHVGDVTDAGITLALNKTSTNLRNWANVIKRVIVTEHSETVQSPIMDTTAESLKAVFGEDNVTVSNDKVNVNLSSSSLPDAEAFLWIMKDGDDLLAIGCTNGQVTAVDNVSFAPNNAINWVPTITALDSGFKLIME